MFGIASRVTEYTELETAEKKNKRTDELVKELYLLIFKPEHGEWVDVTWSVHSCPISELPCAKWNHKIRRTAELFSRNKIKISKEIHKFSLA